MVAHQLVKNADMKSVTQAACGQPPGCFDHPFGANKFHPSACWHDALGVDGEDTLLDKIWERGRLSRNGLSRNIKSPFIFLNAERRLSIITAGPSTQPPFPDHRVY